MSNLNKDNDSSKRMWTSEGAVLIDKSGNVTIDNSLRIVEDQIEDQSQYETPMPFLPVNAESEEIPQSYSSMSLDQDQSAWSKKTTSYSAS